MENKYQHCRNEGGVKEPQHPAVKKEPDLLATTISRSLVTAPPFTVLVFMVLAICDQINECHSYKRVPVNSKVVDPWKDAPEVSKRESQHS